MLFEVEDEHRLEKQSIKNFQNLGLEIIMNRRKVLVSSFLSENVLKCFLLLCISKRVDI